MSPGRDVIKSLPLHSNTLAFGQNSMAFYYKVCPKAKVSLCDASNMVMSLLADVMSPSGPVESSGSAGVPPPLMEGSGNPNNGILTQHYKP